MPICYLVDNGSIRAASVLNLRRVAQELSDSGLQEVRAASLLHSNKVPAEELHGEPAVLLEARLREDLEAGERDFLILPFFFGPTAALTRYLPDRLKVLAKDFGAFRVRCAPFLAGSEDTTDTALARILADRVRETIAENGLVRPPVVLCDHGSPRPEVCRVRDFLAGQISVLLEGEVATVAPASMERREGDKYAFNDPLLAARLAESGFDKGDVVVSLLFLSPGRHAGEDGDVAEICRNAETQNESLRTWRTGLVGTHPDIVALLANRLKAAVAGKIVWERNFS